jgi:SNF2 family DNA or RNA helicase
VKTLPDVSLPRIAYWNYEACAKHRSVGPQIDCEDRACGHEPFRHQRVGITWLYLVRRGLLADDTGLGKTAQVIGLLALLRERGELGRAIVVCGQPAAVKNVWLRDLRRFAPRLVSVAAVGDRYERGRAYRSAWDVLVVGAASFLRDRAIISELPITVLVGDDISALLHPETQTAKAFASLARRVDRVVVLNATPLQMRLQDLYAVSVPLGGREVFGSLRSFERRYVRKEEIRTYSRSGRPVVRWQQVGYRNIGEFRERFEPFILRRRYRDVEGDLDIPEVAPPEVVWGELTPLQRERYAELQEGVVRLLRRGEEVRRVDALTAFTYGAQICSGLQNLQPGDAQGWSWKADWLEEHVLGEWADEKVVVFSQFKGFIRAIKERLERQGVGVAVFWGDGTGGARSKAAEREREEARFWNDASCRVAIGTTSIERSLNLQVARIIVNVDLLLNPQRMVQVLGRVRRVGSAHRRVWVFSLLSSDTQEERYLPVLERRAALSSYVFADENPLFRELSPAELLHLIRP